MLGPLRVIPIDNKDDFDCQIFFSLFWHGRIIIGWYSLCDGSPKGLNGKGFPHKKINPLEGGRRGRKLVEESGRPKVSVDEVDSRVDETTFFSVSPFCTFPLPDYQ